MSAKLLVPRPLRVSDFCEVSEPGLVRRENQDSVLSLPEAGVFLVADGMGGGAEGKRASSWVCTDVQREMSTYRGDFKGRLALFERTLAEANRSIRRYASAQGYRQMGTTAAALLFNPENYSRAAVFHVGDSRVYRLRNGVIEALTQDHTVGAALSAIPGGDRLLGSRQHPLAHVLTRVLGTGESSQVEVQFLAVRPHDRFLICSDGIHDVVDEAQLATLVSRGSLTMVREALRALVLSSACGAPDNFSFILIEIGAGE